MTRKVDPMRGPWRVDLHTHTWASADSVMAPTDLVERAREMGLARVAVTDHNVLDGALEAQALAPGLVIIGEEIEVESGGELIAYYVTELVPAGLPLPEALARLRKQGAVISVSHPLDTLRGSALGRTLTEQFIEQFDALEVFNARCLWNGFNRRAAELARRYGKLGTAGSDAHTLAEVGAGYLTLPAFQARPDALLASLGYAAPGGRLTGIVPHIRGRLARFRRASAAG